MVEFAIHIIGHFHSTDILVSHRSMELLIMAKYHANIWKKTYIQNTILDMHNDFFVVFVKYLLLTGLFVLDSLGSFPNICETWDHRERATIFHIFHHYHFSLKQYHPSLDCMGCLDSPFALFFYEIKWKFTLKRFF